MSNTAILIDRRRIPGARIVPIDLDTTQLTQNTAAHMLRVVPSAVRTRPCTLELDNTAVPCHAVYIYGLHFRGRNSAETSFRPFSRNFNLYGSVILVGEDGQGLDEHTLRALNYLETLYAQEGVYGKLSFLTDRGELAL